jgi:hypothetical protein
MMIKAAAFTALLIFSPILVSATVINIPADYPTIQQGIDASADGDTVLLQPGTYYESVLIDSVSVTLASNYIFSSDTLDILNTIIDGDSTSSALISMGDSSDSLNLKGMTIRNYESIEPHAWAVRIFSGKIENNIFENNIPGAVRSIYFSEIIGNEFRQNNSASVITAGPSIIAGNFFHSHLGSFLISIGGECTIENNLIYDNRFTIVVWFFTAMEANFDGNIVYNNYFPGQSIHGTIIYADWTEVHAENNIIYGNDVGGSLAFFDCPTSEGYFVNNIIWNNIYSDVLFNANCGNLFISYSDIQGGWPGEGNISCDPMFCNPDSGSFLVDGNSCCIGSGLNGTNMGGTMAGCWPPCESYIVGDVNGSGGYDGLDIIYGVAFLKGGPPPTFVCECATGMVLYPGGDVNNSCSYNGLDITYGVAYFKGGSDPIPCQDCPPVSILGKE